MKDKITVIITIRNREAWRIEHQVKSIRENGASPHFHIVDYGSDSTYATEYEEICKNLNLQYTHMYSEGLPWNKCRALNYGAKIATTPFIVTSDVDMIYEGNPFQWCLENYSDKHMYHIETYWLPSNGDKHKATYAGHGNSGGFQFISKKAFEEIKGYDERIVYWGAEDIDWPDRLTLQGYTQIWIPKDFKIYHQWHSKEENGYKRPITASYNTSKFVLENKFEPVLSKNWGKTLEKKDRPILEKISSNNAKELVFSEDTLIFHENIDRIYSSKNDGFVKISLGNRLKKRPLDILRYKMQKVLKPFCALTGNKIQANVNSNFDTLYAVLPVLQQNGLIDYYISADLSEVYLLWK